ncbi:MAG: cytochrome c oxidase assembly protein [Acidimicrobiaceae bacterium]|nr:cytochrome c oxidase assembly protein [Acidimicrobiaceae bacterium]
MPPQMPGMRAPITAHTILTAWQESPFAFAVAASLILAAVLYVVGMRRLARRGRGWSMWRAVSFMAGLLSVELALGSSVSVLSGETFTAHIAQHLLLMVVGPPLLALGAPMTLLLQTSNRPVKTAALKVLHSWPFAVVSHPITVFFLYYMSMFAFFLTGALGYAMEHMWLMDLINVGFFAGATLFWWPMIGLDPIPRWELSPGLKLINLLIGVPFESFLGIALLMKSTAVASMYTVGTTHAGGGLLWAATEIATVAAIIPIFMQWTRADARLARRIDARLDAGEDIQPAPMEGHGLAATMRVLRRG